MGREHDLDFEAFRKSGTAMATITENGGAKS